MGLTTSRKELICLHGLLVVYSLSSICGKLASGFAFLSIGFVLCYGGMIALLGVYAIGWQQIIKRLPLTYAYANRAVTVVWGIIWGALFFHEPVTPLKLVGALVVLAGVVLYATSGDEASNQEVAREPLSSQGNGGAQ